MLLEQNARIVVIRASAVGDVLNTLLAVDAIRKTFPHVFIGYVVDERSVDLVVDHPAIDQVHFFPRKQWNRLFKQPQHWGKLLREVRGYVRELKSVKYDYSLDMQRNIKGGFLALLTGAKRRIGLARPYAIEGNHLLNQIHAAPPPEAKHYAEQFLAIAKHVGANTKDIEFQIPESQACRQRVDSFLKENELEQFFLIHPGTSDFGKLKRWPLENFAEVAIRLSKEKGIRSVIAWGPSESDIASEIVAKSEGHAIKSMQTKSLIELTELIRKAKTFIGCDSGPMHIAGAVKTPCVAIFGPKDPEVYGPYFRERCAIVQPPGGMGATHEITVDRVLDAATKLI